MKRACLVLMLLAVICPVAAAQTPIDVGGQVAIEPARGADPQVDYESLILIGPWDDRNYALTAEDLAWLAPNEAEQTDPIPAFYRVELRKIAPDSRKTGPAQYPRSALNAFRIDYGGYLVDGTLYTRVQRVGQRFAIDLVEGIDADGFRGGTDAVSGEVRITSPNGAAESAIKISPVDTTTVIAGSNGPGGGQKMHWSTDGGETWTQTTLPLGGTCCDPGVDWSSEGQYAYAVTLGSCSFNCGIWFYRSDDGGQSWNGLESVTPGDPRREIGSGDKEFIHVDQSASSPYKDNIYVTWHNGNVMQFAVSTDFGNTFATQSFSSVSSELGIGSDITSDSAGNVYYIWPAFNSRTIRMRKSTDGGQSFGSPVVVASTQGSFIFRLPSIETREAFIYVGADTDRTGGAFDGSVYAAWTDNTGPDSGTPSANHGRIQVAYSRDGGSSWSVTTPHETADQSSVDRWHPWLGVGPDGAVHVIYYDTRRDPSRTSVDLFYSRSTDGAQTWSTPTRVTTELSPNIGDGFEFGDYNGLDIVGNDLIAIFTDNRNETGGTADSVDVYGAGIDPGTGGECGNDLTEPGEACDGTDLGGQSCTDFNCSSGTLACKPDCSGFDTAACSDCLSTCNDNGICEAAEDCTTCPGDCVSGATGGASCGNGVCEAGNGEDCVSCPTDCNGKQVGKFGNRYCCGDGGGAAPVSCADPRCTEGGNSCTDVPNPPGSFCCGDHSCDSGESCANCALDCATGPIEICDNGIDDNCADGADCSDPTCVGDPACDTSCLDLGATCNDNSDCCSNKCRGKGGTKTCR